MYRYWATVIRPVVIALGYVARVFMSLISAISHSYETFLDHYHGPDVRWAVEDFDNWLRWEGKAGKMLDPQDVREKLFEYLNDRGIRWY